MTFPAVMRYSNCCCFVILCQWFSTLRVKLVISQQISSDPMYKCLHFDLLLFWIFNLLFVYFFDFLRFKFIRIVIRHFILDNFSSFDETYLVLTVGVVILLCTMSTYFDSCFFFFLPQLLLLLFVLLL